MALSASIARLEDLRKAVMKNDQAGLENSAALAAKLNLYAGSLGDLFEAGRDMDQASLLEIPIDMLSFLDGDTSNPELYYYHAIEEAEKNCLKVQNRMEHLQSIKPRVDHQNQQLQREKQKEK